MSKSSSKDNPKRRWRMTRRGFLIGAGALTGSVALGWAFGLPYARLKIAEALDNATAPSSAPNEPTAWFEILADSRLRLYVTKSEMGQGVHTALAQFAAEELELTLDDFEVVQATTNHVFRDSMGTAGSNSIAGMSVPMRQAAATLREMLKAQAAEQLNQPVTNLVIRARGIEARNDAARRVEFGKLAASQKAWMARVPEQPVPLKPASAFKVIGQSVPRIDIPAKVTGAATYGYDMRVEGMLYGAVLRPPTLGATLKGAVTRDAEKVDGVRKVVVDGAFAGAVATSRAAAQTAVAAIRADWDQSRIWQQADIDAMVTVGGSGAVTIQQVGSAARVLDASSEGVITAEYRTPMAIQTPMEAQAALADVKGDKATVWSSTQSPDLVRRRVAEAIGFKPEQVEVITTLLGGGFGRKSDTEAAAEAARLSKAAGAPVHVGWTRSEELRHGYVRPPTHHKLRARLDGAGRIEAIEHQQASGDVLFAFFPAIAATILGADFSATRGAPIRYDIANRHTVAWRRQLPVRTGAWRGLGALPNGFAVESFIDEVAHAAGADPLEFRLRHLPDDAWGRRMRAVLQAASDAAGWGTPAPAGRARGIACATDVDTVVAQVAEVSLDAAGKPRVHRVTAAMDCGQVVNPDGAKAQIEGNVMWGVGSALIEAAKLENGMFAAANFDGYPLLSIKDAPVVNAILVPSDDKMRGVGEPSIAPVAAAIGNALFALTGVRRRELPFR